MDRRSHLGLLGTSLLAGCSATRALDFFVPRDTYRLQSGLAYGGDERHRLDIYWPLERASEAPVAIFFYGGNWTRGDRADYRFVGEALASAGVVTVIPDYRLSPAVRWRDILADCALATRWFAAEAARLGASTRRLFLAGHSAGAYNAAMLALDGRWLARGGPAPALSGWAGIAGPYDFLPIVDPDSRVAFDWPETPTESQPVAHVSRGAPPALLIAARKDDTVNPERNTQGLAKALERAGVPVRVHLHDRVSHSTVIGALAPPLRWMAPVREELLAFLKPGA